MMSEYIKGPCVSCGKDTEWACADCRIDTGATVNVCESSECRDKHEETGTCTRPEKLKRRPDLKNRGIA
jgi:hypothetical protein